MTGENGCFPVYLDIFRNIVKYSNRLKELSDNCFFKSAYRYQCSIELDSKGLKTWFTGYKQMVKEFTELNENKINK